MVSRMTSRPQRDRDTNSTLPLFWTVTHYPLELQPPRSWGTRLVATPHSAIPLPWEPCSPDERHYALPAAPPTPQLPSLGLALG